MTRNRLKIEASSLKLEFTGDRDNIERGYEMTRELLINCFLEQLTGEREQAAGMVAGESLSAPPPVDIDRDKTKLMHAVKGPIKIEGRHWSPPEDPDEKIHLSFVLSSEMYNKICVLERESFEESFLGKVFAFERMGRLYVRNSQKRRFEAKFSIGKVLWRELTPKGRRAVRKERG
jgi:hypothetical protein